MADSKGGGGGDGRPTSIGSEFFSISRLFLYKRHIVRCLHLRQMTTRLIHCLPTPRPFSIFLDPPLCQAELQWQTKVIYVCITTNQPDTKSNSNDNPNRKVYYQTAHSSKHSTDCHMSYVSRDIHTRQCWWTVCITLRRHCHSASLATPRVTNRNKIWSKRTCNRRWVVPASPQNLSFQRSFSC